MSKWTAFLNSVMRPLLRKTILSDGKHMIVSGDGPAIGPIKYLAGGQKGGQHVVAVGFACSQILAYTVRDGAEWMTPILGSIRMHLSRCELCASAARQWFQSGAKLDIVEETGLKPSPGDKS